MLILGDNTVNLIYAVCDYKFYILYITVYYNQWYIVYMDSSSCEQTGHHFRMVQCLQKQESRPKCIAIIDIEVYDCNKYIYIYKPSLLTAWCDAQCKRPPTVCKHWKQFSAQDEHFDWLEIIGRFYYPMAQVSACSHLSPGDDRLLISGKTRFSNACKYMPMIKIYMYI